MRPGRLRQDAVLSFHRHLLTFLIEVACDRFVPDDLVERQRNLDQTEVVQAHVQRHEDTNADEALVLSLQRVSVL